MLRRKIYDTLLNWKQNHGQECLLIKGARQIGKTYIIDYFGRKNYKSYLYINFIFDSSTVSIFDGNLDIDSLIKTISLIFPSFKLLPNETLIFLDEIQACPRARTALKSFALDGRIDVIASGSLLGINFFENKASIGETINDSIPVGYEHQIMMYSLDFEEYLWARGYTEENIGILKEAFQTLTPLPTPINEKMHELFREYLINGGMPEVVNSFVETNNYGTAFDVQKKILNSNLDDIARYASVVEKPKIRACYLSLPAQLAKENKKFKYSVVEKGGSSRRFSTSIDWLKETSLVNVCHNVTSPNLPLSVYKIEDIFKLYVTDVGIYCAMMGFEIKNAIYNNTISGFAKGGIYENAIMAFLVRRGYTPYYWLPKTNLAEIDFLIEKDGVVVPIEVKSSNNTSKTFDELLKREDIKYGYKLVYGNIGKSGKKITLPHYMAMFI